MVWRALCGDRVVALKVGKDTKRFRDEIDIHRSLRDRPGVLRFVNADATSRPPWLATTEATKIQQSLRDASLEQVVTAVAQIATTLAGLADVGIFHRDLKPDNLFHVDGAYVVGDFGLAAFPAKHRHTTNTRKLGPWGFIAPEMLTSPRQAHPGPADVYSIVKTFWCLASGVHWPPLGEQRLEYPPSRLSSALAHERAALLDPVIDRATRNEPSERPTMRVLQFELEAWLAGPPAPPVEISLDYLASRAQAILAPEREESEARQRASDRASAAYPELQGRLQPIQENLGKLSLPGATPGGPPGPGVWEKYMVGPLAGVSGTSNQLGPVPGSTAWLWFGSGWGPLPDGQAYLVVVIVRGEGDEHQVVARASATVEPGTAFAASEAARLAAVVEDAIVPAVSELLDAIEQQRAG